MSGLPLSLLFKASTLHRTLCPVVGGTGAQVNSCLPISPVDSSLPQAATRIDSPVQPQIRSTLQLASRCGESLSGTRTADPRIFRDQAVASRRRDQARPRQVSQEL